ncbi:MAG TPA: hypothetical protein VFF73_41090 [Planctomycetota bacterium]|nr:hypothetical protein [Planctomycetota bacterium]
MRLTGAVAVVVQGNVITIYLGVVPEAPRPKRGRRTKPTIRRRK